MRSFVRPIFLFALFLFLLTTSPVVSTHEAYGSPDKQASPAVREHEVNNVFDIANEEYKAGNFEDAAKLYEGLVSGPGLKTADIYYNLGNACFKLHKYGKAIASYQRALRLAPREQDVLANLRYVRSLTKDKIDRPRSTEMLQGLLFFHYALNRPESEAAFLAAYFATALFAIACLFRKAKTLKWLTIASLVLALTFGASTAMHAYRAAHPVDAVVSVEETGVHTGPGDTYILAFNLHDGAEFEVRSRVEGWLQVELPDGRRGWVRDSHVEIIS